MAQGDSLTLRGWLDEQKIADQEFARRLKISASHLSLVASRRRTASLELALKIEEETGGRVPLSSLVAERATP